MCDHNAIVEHNISDGRQMADDSFKYFI